MSAITQEMVERYACTHKPKLLVSNAETGEAFIPDCNSYKCQYCARRKARIIAAGIASCFEGKQARLVTFTTTDRFNSALPAALPVLAWREFLRNLRNYKAFRGFDRLQFIRVVEYQKNGNPHFHCLFDSYIPVRIVEALWRMSVVRVLAKTGITVAPEQKISNVNMRGLDGNDKAVFRYVLKYISKGLGEFQASRTPGERYRPFSASRGFRVLPVTQKTPGWRVTRFADLRSLGLYSLDVGLLPKEVDGRWIEALHDCLYSGIHGEDYLNDSGEFVFSQANF